MGQFILTIRALHDKPLNCEQAQIYRFQSTLCRNHFFDAECVALIATSRVFKSVLPNDLEATRIGAVEIFGDD